MKHGAQLPNLQAEQRQQIAAWFEQNKATLPEVVRSFFSLHQPYLVAGGDPRKHVDSVWRELRRALGITPSSERRPSGSPLSTLPREKRSKSPQGRREKLEEQIGRSTGLSEWHRGLDRKHKDHVAKLAAKLAKMPLEKMMSESEHASDGFRVEDIELSEEQKAANAAAAKSFVGRLCLGDGVADSELESVNEALMPCGAVLAEEATVGVAVELPAALSEATVVKELNEQRVRYDFSVAVTRIEIDVEKKVVLDEHGERHVLSASTLAYGPPRYAVTWSALATLAVMVAQFAIPFNRLGVMLTTATKRFTAGALSRMLHYVAVRLVPIYLELAAQLANSDILAGDDTSCRVLEVSNYFGRSRRAERCSEESKEAPPWKSFRTCQIAEASMRECEQRARERTRRREDGEREATRMPDETPSLGVLIGRKLAFESPRRNGDGAKQSLNTTVVSGRGAADDPRSLVVFYRSHLGGCGNLFAALLRNRNPKARKVILQGDLSSTNLVTSPELLKRFDIKTIGCSAHARRPFANYEHEDPEYCAYMLHSFLGLAMHEQRLDAHGRNRENTLAVRRADSRELWEKIRALAEQMTEKWSKETKLGAGARYIIKHFDKLTAYLDDPRLEPTNNLRERMLRMEKLIEGSSMFRRSIEGRFVLDIVRTVLQTAVAAGVPVHEYLVSVLRANPDEVAKHPQRFTPRGWAEAEARPGHNAA